MSVRMIPLGEKGAQQQLIKPSPEELAQLKERLSGYVGEYIKIEDEKKAADADWNEQLSDLWEEIRGLRARIKEGEAI